MLPWGSSPDPCWCWCWCCSSLEAPENARPTKAVKGTGAGPRRPCPRAVLLMVTALGLRLARFACATTRPDAPTMGIVETLASWTSHGAAPRGREMDAAATAVGVGYPKSLFGWRLGGGTPAPRPPLLPSLPLSNPLSRKGGGGVEAAVPTPVADAGREDPTADSNVALRSRHTSCVCCSSRNVVAEK